MLDYFGASFGLTNRSQIRNLHRPTNYRRALVNMRPAQLTRVADESQSGDALSQSGNHCSGCLKVNGVKRVLNELQV